MDVAKIGINVEANGIAKTFAELDKLAKSSSEVSKQMDKLVPLVDKFTKVNFGNQADKLRSIANAMSTFSKECNSMATAVGNLKVNTTGLRDLNNAISSLSKIGSAGLGKHAQNIEKLSTAMASTSAFANTSKQMEALSISIQSLNSAPTTIAAIALAGGEFKGKSTSINNFTASLERLATISMQLPHIAGALAALAPSLSGMSGVSAPVNALIGQLKALQGVMTTTVSQANAATTQTASAASRKQSSGGGDSGFGIGTLLAGAGVGLSAVTMIDTAKGAVALADKMANLEARVRLVTSGTKELNAIQSQLFSEANKSGTSVAALTETYVALSRSTKSLQLDQSKIVDLSAKMSMAFKVGGGDAASFNSAMVQMNQGLSSGVLRGQEFNSMSEQAPIILTALRKGLEATTGAIGLTEGQLRKMANAGLLTTDVVIPALQVGLKDIEQQFKTLPLTAERGWAVLTNTVAKSLGEMNKSTGATQSIAEGFISLSKVLEDNKGTFEALAGAIPIAALGALTLALAHTAKGAVTSFMSMAAANEAQAVASLASRTAEVERLAALNAGIPVQQRSTASITESMMALRLQAVAAEQAAFALTGVGRAGAVVGGIFNAMGGWVTLAAVAITGIIYYWDELSAAMGNVSAKAKQAEKDLQRAMRLKDVGLIGARQGELKASIISKESQLGTKESDLKGLEFFAAKEGKGARSGLIAQKKKEIEEFKLEIMDLKASITQSEEAVKSITEEKAKPKEKPRTGVDVLADKLQSSVSTKENKGKLALAMLADQTKLANNMKLSLEVRQRAEEEVAKLQAKSYEYKGKMYSLIDYEAITENAGKAPKAAKAPKGLSAIQSRDSAADADYKAALEEQSLLQNNSAESLDKLTVAGKKALQVEAQLAEAKKAGSKVGKEVISSLERDLEVYKKTATIQENNILVRQKEAAATLEASKTADVLSASLVRTNEFLSARDELIRSGNVAEVVEADQKKLLSMRKAFMLELAKIDQEIAASLSSKETAALIERRTGLKANFDRVNQQVGVPADKFDMKTVEGVRGMEAKSLQESTASFERGKTDLAGQMGEASSSDVQQQLGDEYNNMLEAQKQREIDIHQSADEKIKSIEKEKTDRQMAMLKTAESFANTMMDITSNEGKDKLAKEKENFKSQSGLYKAFFVFKQATAIAQATVAGTLMAAEMAAWGAAMAGPVGAAAGQAIGYGIMGANIGMIAGQTIGMFAKGSAFDGGGVVSSPTAFSHGGGKGVMGEAGPEGILPLATGPDGKLGVQMYGGDKSNGGGISKITIVNQTTGRIDSVEEKQISPTERQIIIKEAIETMNGNLANPNSSTSKAMNSNYVGMRRNR